MFLSILDAFLSTVLFPMLADPWELRVCHSYAQLIDKHMLRRQSEWYWSRIPCFLTKDVFQHHKPQIVFLPLDPNDETCINTPTLFIRRLRPDRIGDYDLEWKLMFKVKQLISQKNQVVEESIGFVGLQCHKNGWTSWKVNFPRTYHLDLLPWDGCLRKDQRSKAKFLNLVNTMAQFKSSYCIDVSWQLI